MYATEPTAFDAFAPSYDDHFTHSRLGRLLRQRVWDVLASCFSAGQHVLEIACGTGEDAVWLAGRGVEVTATDGSVAMTRVATSKAASLGVGDLVHVQQLSLQQLGDGHIGAVANALYDGALSNFGGLNTVSNWSGIGAHLFQLLRPGAPVVLVPMGPFCPWEILCFMGHGQLRNAFRRYRQPATARIGTATIPVWYPSARQLRKALSPWFHHVRTENLGLWLPPTYLGHFADRFRQFSALLQRLDEASASLGDGWGDHYIAVFTRR